jgi:hypothetical protein
MNKLMQKYDNFSPKHKAMIDMAAVLGLSIISSGIVALVAYFQLWTYFGIFIVLFSIVGFVRAYYNMRLTYHELDRKYNDKS